MMNSIYEEVHNSSTEEYRYLKSHQLTQMEYTPWPIPFNLVQALIGCVLGCGDCCCDHYISEDTPYIDDYTPDHLLKKILYCNMVVAYFRETLTEPKYKKALRMFDKFEIPIGDLSPPIVFPEASTVQKDADSSTDDDSIKTFRSGLYTGHWMQDDNKGEMNTKLSFINGKVIGKGFDEVGPFQWSGTYKDNDILMEKQYVGAHKVIYKGTKCGHGAFKGTWTICDFHEG
jgi:hypothetical protein